MDDLIGVLLALIVAIVLLGLFYIYMNYNRGIYSDFDSNKLKSLPWYSVPRWVKDAWDPTWVSIQRVLINLQTKI